MPLTVCNQDCSMLTCIHLVIMHLQVVLLDERGRDLGSEDMAELLGDAGNTVGTIPLS